MTVLLAVAAVLVYGRPGVAQLGPPTDACPGGRAFYMPVKHFWEHKAYYGVVVLSSSPITLEYRLPDGRCVNTVGGSADPVLRRQAYMMGMGRLFSAYVPASMGAAPTREISPTEWSTDPAFLRNQERLLELTGLRWDTLAEAAAWWVENRAYLRWSPTRGEYELDAEAKRRGEVITEDLVEFDAERFRDSFARCAFEDIRVQGEFIIGVSRTRFGSGVLRAIVRVPRSALAETDLQHGAMLQVIEEYATWLWNDPDSSSDGLPYRLDCLAQRTDQAFTSPLAWKPWFDANKDRLVLSADGERLVVRAPNASYEPGTP